MSHAATLPLDELAQRCASETARYRNRQPNDTQFCFELLRRAFNDASSEAFTRAYQIYEQLVIGWVKQHTRFAQTHESEGYFASGALMAFYLGVKRLGFGRFPNLAAMLEYLKICTANQINQYLRDTRPGATLPLLDGEEPGYLPNLDTTVALNELWQRICALLPEEADRLLAHCVFLQGMKPRQVTAAYRNLWPNERAVSVALFRIRQKLRSDPLLHAQVREV